MTTLVLKSYQQAALDALAAFARAAQIKGAALAFGELAGRPYNPDAFGEVPCVCLRIPTGGGKTLLAAHAVATLAREWQASDAPVALWLVPSDTIRSQTLRALQTAGHPYRDALEASYGADVRVCVLEDLAPIPPGDWGRKAVVVVATIQSFRIDDTDKRNVYSFSESLERHFQGCDEQRLRVLHGLPDALVTPAEVAADRSGVLQGREGQPRWSLANWLALHAPLLIVDEAHNTKTDKSFTALRRLNPSAILELTATPIAAQTNVLYHVSAQELAAESMIKLPIALAEHPQGWQQAVFAAVQNQRALEAEALKDEAGGFGYVRPIALFQAQNENDEVPPEALRRHLEDELHIPKEQIKVATGETRELEGLDLAKARFKLAQDIEARVGDLKDKAAKAGFRQLVLEESWTIEPDWTRPLVFEAHRYPVPAGSRYGGRYEFSKHFYPVLAELLDGRVAVVEYKGAHLLNDPYEIEKRQVGELWARKSQARCLFGQIALQKNGLGMAGQLDALLN